MTGFDQTAKSALQGSRRIARQREHHQVELIDMFAAALHESSAARQAIERQNATIPESNATSADGSRRLCPFRMPIGFSDEVKSLVLAVGTASSSTISSTLLCARILEQHDEQVDEMLRSLNVDPQLLLAEIRGQ